MSNKLKQSLIEKYGDMCFLYGESYPEQLLQVDHRIPYEILVEQDENDINNFMLLSPSGNRVKSWACEHCENWDIKDVSICNTCYYAHPENYNHIAKVEERKLEIIFKSDDMYIYEELKKMAKEENISLQKAFKKIFNINKNS